MINKEQLEKANDFQKTVAEMLKRTIEETIEDPKTLKVKVDIEKLKIGLADPKKTLSKMEDYVKNKAKKDAKGGSVSKTDFWVLQEACNYYTSKEKPKKSGEELVKELNEKPKAPKKEKVVKATSKKKIKPKVKVVEKELDLFDL